MSWIWSRSARRIAWVLFFAFIWTCIGEMPASAAVKACKELRDAAMPKCVALSDKEMAQIVGGCTIQPPPPEPCDDVCGCEIGAGGGAGGTGDGPTLGGGGGCGDKACLTRSGRGGLNSQNGNMTFSAAGSPMPPIPGRTGVGLYQNSQETAGGIFGQSWTHTYSTNLTEDPADKDAADIRIIAPNGRRLYFTANNADWKTSTTAAFTGMESTDSELVKESGTYKLSASNGTGLSHDGDIVHMFGSVSGGEAKLGKILIENDPVTSDDDQVTSLEYSSGNISAAVDSAGNRTTFIYIGGTSRVNYIQSPGDIRTTFSYTMNTDSKYDLTSIIYAVEDGQPPATANYSYDAAHKVTRYVYGGACTTYTYTDATAAGRLWEKIDPLGNRTTYGYYPDTGAVQKLWEIHPSLARTTHENNYSVGNLYPLYKVDADGNRTSFKYDSAGRVTSKWYYIDGQLCTVHYTYDATTGNVSKVLYAPASTSVVYTYYSDGDIKTVTNEMGQTTSYTYDNHRIATIKNPLGDVTTYVYNSSNSGPIRVEVTGETGVSSTAYTYLGSGIAAGQVQTVTDGVGNVTTRNYDSYGNLRSAEASPSSGVTYLTTVSYDLMGREKTVSNPDSTEVNFTYDCCNVKTITDENGNVTTLDYWADLSQKSVEDSENQVTETSHGYISANNESWKTLENAEGKTTTYTFDVRGLLKKAHYADGTSERYTYEEFGKPKTKIDQIGRTTTFSYDTRGRLTKIDYPNLQDMLYYYDDAGRRTGMADRGGNTSYVYYADGSLKSKRFAQAGTGYEMRVTYSYYPDGNRQDMAINGSTTAYHYDAGGRLKWFTNSDGLETTYYYDGIGRTVKRSLDNGAYTSYYYSNRSWVTDIQNMKRDGSTVLSSFSYSYSDNGVTDNVGNILKIVQKLSDGQIYTSTYTYDDVYRLTGERRDGPSAYGYTYTYDEMGNRLTMPIEGDGVTTYAYDLDSNNELDTEWSGATTNTYTYDGNGNTIRKVVSGGGGTTTFTYSDDNKMTRITYPDSTSSLYASDGDGRRARHRAPNGDLECYFYDGDQLVLVKDANGNDIARYTYGPDGLVYMRRVGTGTDYYYGCDHLGSVWNLVTADANETIAATYTYTAFGNVTAEDSVGNPFRYVGTLGYYHDYADSGLMLLGHRYYNPSVGKFTILDPIRDGFNWYAYTDNQPTRYTDPSGLTYTPCQTNYDEEYKKCVKSCDDSRDRKIKEIDRRKNHWALVCAGLAYYPPAARACATSLAAWYSTARYGIFTTHVECVHECRRKWRGLPHPCWACH